MADHIDRLREYEYEDEHGYVRVRLTLISTEDGGRQTPVRG
jgi:hypothetical protein